MKHKVEIELPFFMEYPDYHDDALSDFQVLIPGLQSREMGLTEDGLYLFAYFLIGDEITDDELWEIAESKDFNKMTDEEIHDRVQRATGHLRC